MKSVIATAKSVEKAIEEGLAQLNTTIENVEVNIINEGGLLKRAKVELTLIEESVEDVSTPKEIKKPTIETTKPQVVEEEIEVDTTDLEEDIKRLEEQIKSINGVKAEDEAKKEDMPTLAKTVETFLSGLIYSFNINATVEIEETNNLLKARILGDNLGVLIGYHGESLDAIGYILSNYVYNKLGRTKKISLDIENYKDKRAETIKQMAENLADKVIKSKRSFKLEPMNSFERKTIHAHLQNKEHISTHSEGKEPNRFLVIDYVE